MTQRMTKPADVFVCPECGKSGFKNYSGLAGHLAAVHKIRLGPREKSKLQVQSAHTLTSKPAQPKAREKEKKGNRVPTPESVPVTRPAPTVPAASVPITGAHEHLKTALQELTQRNRQIDEELARMEGLQSEKEMIRKQIDAVNSALQAFGV